jgi:predicted RNase H-like nuclease (RuvC/YqgF family)
MLKGEIMQKDIALTIGETLSESINSVNNRNQTKSLIELVKRQAEEIDRRGQLVMRMEESVKLQQQNIEKLIVQNRHLESLLQSLKDEREKMVEELKLLQQNSSPKVSKRKVKQENVVEAA